MRLCRVAYHAAQRQVLFLGLRPARQARQVDLGQLALLAQQVQPALLVYRVSLARPALQEQLDLQAPPGQLVLQALPLLLQDLLARLALRDQPDLPDLQAPQERLARKAPLDRLVRLALLGRQDLLVRKVFKVSLGQLAPQGQRGLLVLLELKVFKASQGLLDPLGQLGQPERKVFKALLVLRGQQVQLDLLDHRVSKALRDRPDRLGQPARPARPAQLVQLVFKDLLARQDQLAPLVCRPVCSRIKLIQRSIRVIRVMVICFGTMLRRQVRQASISAI